MIENVYIGVNGQAKKANAIYVGTKNRYAKNKLKNGSLYNGIDGWTRLSSATYSTLTVPAEGGYVHWNCITNNSSYETGIYQKLEMPIYKNDIVYICGKIRGYPGNTNWPQVRIYYNNIEQSSAAQPNGSGMNDGEWHLTSERTTAYNNLYISKIEVKLVGSKSRRFL